jgi:NAD(P)-dependent dehydrogenase (short-subunit alcohol dehydrogenase family)
LRLIRPDEIADATVWLANSAADAFIDARAPVDGGLCL